MNRPSWIGQTLGERYRIDEIIGQGGMSAVYKAFDPNLKRVVAIKMIHPHLADDPKFLVRFEEEATAVAQLRHPNIVQVYDFNHDGNVYYMVQEFVPGETLQDRLRRLNRDRRQLPIDEAIQYIINICDASGYAHKRGMIHRDIKPANIMLDVQGQAVLMDFGIVKITGGERHTATGAVVGTALYLPPEVIRGESPDPRSDMYSLGTTFYEMLSGKPPFEADSAMTLMMMHLNDPVPDPRNLRPEMPESLIKILNTALAKNRDQRYASMAEFASALANFKAGIQPGVVPAAATTIDTGLAASANPTPAISVRSTTIDQGPNVQKQPPAADSHATVLDSQPLAAAALAGTMIDSGPTPPPGTTQSQPQSIAGKPPLPPSSASSASQPASASAKRRWIWIAGGILAILILAIGSYFTFFRPDDSPGQVALAPTATEKAIIQPATQTPTIKPTSTATITPTLLPSETPTPTLSPTPTIPVGVPYVSMKSIGIDQQNNYIVNYETFEYTEQLPGDHVHFFFNTVPPEQAGRPGAGNWYVWGGPRPFNRFRLSDRPEDAVQMCALVANPDHSVKPLSGNCLILPDINVAAPYEDMACLEGPADGFPAAAFLKAGQLVQVLGISPDEAWWNVKNQDDTLLNCWLLRLKSDFQGDLSTLPLVEPPPPPAEASKLLVEITAIGLDSQGNYVVDYITKNYTEQLPGTHIHFFYDIFSIDQVGPSGGGNRLMYGGPSPFNGFNSATRPADAKQICALVAQPNHTVIPESGNCFKLPDIP